MKKVILLVAVLAATFACKKDKKDDPQAKFCYACTVSQAVDGGQVSTTTVEQCDMTEDQKNAFEKAGTSTTTMGGMTMKVTTKCTKK